MQSDFFIQKREIEEIITDFSIYANRSHNIVLLYLKFYYKLNHIKHFWYHFNGYARYFCKYSLKKLCIQLNNALSSIFNFTILGNYNCYREKIVLYRARIEYKSLE